jgi:hypothetical protein
MRFIKFNLRYSDIYTDFITIETSINLLKYVFPKT